MYNRNPIARNAWKFNKPKVVKAKKGKGSSHNRSIEKKRAKEIMRDLGYSRVSANMGKY